MADLGSLTGPSEQTQPIRNQGKMDYQFVGTFDGTGVFLSRRPWGSAGSYSKCQDIGLQGGVIESASQVPWEYRFESDAGFTGNITNVLVF